MGTVMRARQVRLWLRQQLHGNGACARPYCDSGGSVVRRAIIDNYDFRISASRDAAFPRADGYVVQAFDDGMRPGSRGNDDRKLHSNNNRPPSQLRRASLTAVMFSVAEGRGRECVKEVWKLYELSVFSVWGVKLNGSR